MGFAEGYNTVAERIAEWREQYPDGTLAPVDLAVPYRIETVGSQTFLVVVAAAYRTPDDPRPGVGMAWEPLPGLTNFTRNSELQNAETSAWGRAIIAVGAADAKKGVASRDEVERRQSESEYLSSEEYAEMQAVPGLRTSLKGAIDKWIDGDDGRAEALKAWFAGEGLPPVRVMSAAQCDLVMDYLMALPDEETDEPDPV